VGDVLNRNLKLMCVLAHPDDESMGTGSTLAKYPAEGVETTLVMATRGERGWNGDPSAYPGLEGLGKLREAELLDAAKILGIREVEFLDYIDGDLDKADPRQAIAKIVATVRRFQPHVVVTFGPDGAYGHPDHIAISQFTTAALLCAADASYAAPDEAHQVSKLYYWVADKKLSALYEAGFGEIMMRIDEVERRGVAWEEWAITTRIDGEPYWRIAWQAVASHRTQLPNLERLQQLPDDHHRQLWGRQLYYRALSVVNGGRAVETDLFEGIR
jgi:LmbE family N-acetylglucosaminyl deacetylase